MQVFERRLQQYIEDYQIFAPGDCIGIGVSGGADSVALLRGMVELAKTPGMQYQICVCHIEHGIRGQESREDAAFVENLCQKLGVLCKTYAVDAVAFARDKGYSLEEGARILRYEKLKAFAKEMGAKLAVAHHGNDNVETMLFQLGRGSGLRGFAGMQPVKTLEDGGCIIGRPMLFATRQEILDYLRALQQEYRTDSTNADTEYARNRIRQEVIPLLEEINPQAVSHMMRAMEMLQPVLQQHFQSVDEKLQYVMDETGCLLCSRLQAVPCQEQMEILHAWMRKCSAHGKDLGWKHIEAIQELLYKEVGKSLDIPYGRVQREYETLRYYGEGCIPTESRTEPKIQKQGPKGPEEVQQRLLEPITVPPLDLHMPLTLNLGDYTAELQVVEGETMEEIPEITYTKWFDYDKIQDSIQFRNRCPGDRIAVVKNGSKKLKDYFIDAKIPQVTRGNLILLADGQNIVWVVSGRISEAYKVDEHTKRILRINLWRNSET